MNPYRALPIYTPDKVEEYRNRNFYELSPHMWVHLPHPLQMRPVFMQMSCLSLGLIYIGLDLCPSLSYFLKGSA